MKKKCVIVFLLILFPLICFGGDEAPFNARGYFGSYLPAGSRYEGNLGSFTHIFTSTASFDDVKAFLHQKGGRDRKGKLISKEYLPGVSQKDELTYKSYLGKLNEQWNFRLDSHRYNVKQGKWHTKTTIVFTGNRSRLATEEASQNSLLPSIPEIRGSSQMERKNGEKRLEEKKTVKEAFPKDVENDPKVEQEIKRKPKDVVPIRRK